MKRLISALLAVVLLIGTALISVSAVTLPFADVKGKAWFFENVSYVYENGIMNGTSDTRFEPNSTLSRAMAVTILYRMSGDTVAEDAENPFADVKNGTWYTDAVKWAYGCGIVTGMTENTFEPTGNIIRADFAVLLSRYAYYKELELPELRENANFYDSSITPKYAKTAEKLLYRAAVINGFPNNRFMHYQTITRAEAAAMIHRFLDCAHPIDTTAYTDIVFMGNSITVAGRTPDHFEALAVGTDYKVHNISSSGNYLGHHLEDLESEYMSPYVKNIEKAEIVILQEYAGAIPMVGEDAELAELRYKMNHPSVMFASGTNVVGKLMDLLGRDKEYYSYSANLAVGPMKTETFIDWNGQLRKNDNDVILRIKDILAERYDLDHLYVTNIAISHPELGLPAGSLYPDQVHPTELMGYIIALSLYCKIENVPATEQNNGDLSPASITGETEAEKAEFMEKLKLAVQEILDMQKQS